jgi:hypothetical protein
LTGAQTEAQADWETGTVSVTLPANLSGARSEAGTGFAVGPSIGTGDSEPIDIREEVAKGNVTDMGDSRGKAGTSR